MFDLQKFAVTKAKPLPVYLLLDVSTTMAKVEDNDNLKRTGEKFFKDGQQWEDYQGGLVFGWKLSKSIGIFFEGEYTKFWDSEIYNSSVGLNITLK